MRETIRITAFSLIALLILDATVGLAVHVAKSQNRVSGLTDFLDLGRSVPGKLAHWQSDGLTPGNPLTWAWMDERLNSSNERAEIRPAQAGPRIHSYGMSFTRNVVREAVEIDTNYDYVPLGGPNAPPNHTYTLIVQDRPNRRAGDVIVFGLLSSSLPGLGSLSNRSWLFEQPAPYTYPKYLPHQDGLRATTPLVPNLETHLKYESDPAKNAAWMQQLQNEDALYTSAAFELSWLDHSTLARMLRRSLAQNAIAERKAAFMQSSFPRKQVLARMLADISKMAAEDDQKLVVLLSQTINDPYVDLRAELEPILAQLSINYVSTQDIVSASDPLNFVSDGHYAPALDRRFAQALLDHLGE